MADFNNRLARATTATATYDAGLRAHMLRVYNYMTGALAVTGLVAYAVANTPALLNLFFHEVITASGSGYAPTMLGYLVAFAPIGLVLLFSFRLHAMSLGAAQTVFWSYAALLGASLSTIVLFYTTASVATAFFVTAAAFGSMSLYGYTTGRDLTGIGSFLFMGLIGLVVASLVNIFLQSAAINFMVSVLGVVIFTGLTAWHTQSIKQEYYMVGGDSTMAGKAAIRGALLLYMDFINIFLSLLRLMGSRR
jgi:FtsH-binding integral membrane protein